MKENILQLFHNINFIAFIKKIQCDLEYISPHHSILPKFTIIPKLGTIIHYDLNHRVQ